MEKTSSSITATRNGRYLLFGFLYFVQGALLAYVLVFNNLYLRQFGASAGQLSLLNGLLVVPFILKIGIGILSDKAKIGARRPLLLLGQGHRLPYIRMGLLLIAAGSTVAVFIHPVTMYPVFLLIALLIACGLAFFDTITDGLAIDVTPKDQQKFVQGAMVIGRAAGLVMLAAVYARIIQAYDWRAALWGVSLLALTPLLILRYVQEPVRRPSRETVNWQALTALWRPEIGRFSVYAIIYAIPVYGTNAIITLFANEGLGGTLVQVGYVAALAGLGMLIGGLAAVALARGLSIWRQANWTTAAVTLTLALIALAADLQSFLLITLVWGFCLSAADFIFVTLSMAKADRRMGAGHFAIFMALSNVGTAIGQTVSTGLVDTINFHWIFAGMALINMMVFPLLAFMRKDTLHEQNSIRFQLAE